MKSRRAVLFLASLTPSLLFACNQSNGTGQDGGSSGSSQSPDGSSTSGSSGSTSSGASSGSPGTAGSSGATGSSSGAAGSSGGTTSSGDSGSGSGSGGSSSGSAATDGGAGDGGAKGDGGAIGDGGDGGDAMGNGCEPSDGGNIIGTINNTGSWNDTSGTHIQAHGGGLIKVCDTWYWFGEDNTLNTNGTGNFHAISCYASKDLATWEHRGQVVTNNTASVLNNTSLIIERPKVVYNASTKLYVMWAHWDMESCSGVSGSYCDSEAVVFTSPTVDGSYTYVSHFKPGGNGSRDCTLWQEPVGTAYFVSTGGTNGAGNFTATNAYQLSSDYLTVQTTTPIWTANGFVEAYAFWKDNGKYYGVCSGQTGWAPNQARYLTSTGSITGPWNTNFTYLGPNGSTWNSQPTYVIPVVGTQTTTYIYASDIWNSNNLSLSTYLWLPFTFDGTTWTLSNSAQWSINLTTGVVSTN